MKYAFWILLISLIIFRYFLTLPKYKDGDKIRITATVLSDPIKYEKHQYINSSGLKIYLPKFPEIVYGDKVIIEGLVEGDRLVNPELINATENNNYIFNARKNIIAFYNSSLPDPYSGLIAGITLGSKGSLTNEFWEKVKRTGVAHVVVASGTNVTLVTSFLVAFLSLVLPRRKMIVFVVLGIILYLFISGFEAPLIRAAIMGIIAFVAQSSGRLVTSIRALIISAALMLVINPNWISDLGFILSFVATFSLILFERKIRERLKAIPEIFKEGLSTSLAAQIGVAPILFVTFGGFNILSPFINVLILWTIPLIMVFGALGGVIGLMIPIFGKIILYLSYPLLWWFNLIVTLLDF